MSQWTTRTIVIVAIVAGLMAGAVGMQGYVWVRDVIADHALLHAIRHDPELARDLAFLRRARASAEQAKQAQ